MSNCTADQFLGVWEVTHGFRAGQEILIAEDEWNYTISVKDRGEKAHLDRKTFILKNDRIAVSLWQDCGQLFGAEGSGQNLEVWAATRHKDSRPGRQEKPTGDSPSWGGVHTVYRRYPKMRFPDKSPLENQKIKITERTEGFDITVVGAEAPYDTLIRNEGNRTLDTAEPEVRKFRRSVAQWFRNDQKCIFAMLIVDPSTGLALREALQALPGWRPPTDWTPPDWSKFLNSEEVVAVLRRFRLLPFELGGLVARWRDREDGGVVVWGADEG